MGLDRRGGAHLPSTSIHTRDAVGARAGEQQGVKPFLRWGGSKRWLAPKLRELVADISYTGYHEPFVGGGSLFFALASGARMSSGSE